jgi:hypothetical protein
MSDRKKEHAMTTTSRRITVQVVLILALIFASGAADAGQQADDHDSDGKCQLPGDGVNGTPLRYQLRSDGTVSDLNTGLVWEPKDTAGGIHDVSQTFLWSATGAAPDGTAFTVFLNTINNRCDGAETTTCTSDSDCSGIGTGMCGYAGHRDWRMPNVKELQSIVDYSTEPAINPIFGPPPGRRVWSFTTLSHVGDPAFKGYFAFFIDFDRGDVIADSKTQPFYNPSGYPVLAVRDGRCIAR